MPRALHGFVEGTDRGSAYEKPVEELDAATPAKAQHTPEVRYALLQTRFEQREHLAEVEAETHRIVIEDAKEKLEDEPTQGW